MPRGLSVEALAMCITPCWLHLTCHKSVKAFEEVNIGHNTGCVNINQGMDKSA
jgi:hypothetical protein